MVEPDKVETAENEPGPGWMPAILAGLALFGIIGFIFCAFSTWMLFQKRTEFALRTLSGSYIPQVEQSLLDPLTKESVIREIEGLITDMKRGKYENWQSAGIMQRLQRLPVFQWGELDAVEAYLEKFEGDGLSEEQRLDGIKQIGRLKRAVEIGKATSFDFVEVLKPVRTPDPNSPTGYDLVGPLEPEAVIESIGRAKLLADQSKVPDQSFDDVRIEKLLRREIELGGSQGGF